MGKVLVVDDTKNIRMMLTTCLELEGYEVIQAKNGLESLDILENTELEMAFIDIKMPEISGTEVLRRIRSKGINTPIIIMTAFATVRNAIECTKLGAVAYLQKPFTADKVKGVLREIREYNESSENIKYHISMAKDALNNSRADEAISILRKALSVEPTNGEIYYLLGKAYEYNGAKEEAVRFYSISEIFGYNNM